VRKGKELLGKPVITYDTGERINRIKDLIFDENDSSLLGFLVAEKGWFNNAKVLPLFLVSEIGADAIIVPSKDAIAPSRDYGTMHNILANENILNGTRIMTTDGRDLGKLIDFYFDEKSGAIEGYETSGGLFADAYSGRSFVPATHTLKIGEDVAFVPIETIALMEEQVGGIKAAMQTASEKLQSTAQVAGERLHDTAQVAGERFQDTAQIAGARLQTAGRTVNTRFTNAIVDRSEQKAFAIGKMAQFPVKAPNGIQVVSAGEIINTQVAESAERLGVLDELYRSAGGSLTEPLRDRMGNAMAGFTIEQAQGRRAQREVYTPQGYIIAAQGQIVTQHAIDRAKATHQESALLEAVGLSNSVAARSQAGALATTTGNRLKTTTANTSERVREGALTMWEHVKETANDLQGRSKEAIEEKRIKGALGRPTTRVILDRNDEVILNVGELINHKAIDGAREAGILDILLDSVYTETPHLSIDELRAPVKGRAAF
jgi:uncharacterized protein YrrD